MNWFNQFVDYILGPERKQPTPVVITELERMPTGTKVTAQDAFNMLYQKTMPIQHSYHVNQVIMANLETWNKIS